MLAAQENVGHVGYNLMSKYRSLENIIRTRHLTEIHRDTMDIPHNIDVPQVARDSHHIDQLHDIYHRATKMGSTDKQEVARAEEIVSKIKKIAELNKVGIEHHHLDDIVNAIKAYSMNDKEIEDDINKDKIVDIFSKLKSVQPSKKVESDVEDHHLARSKTQARFLRTKDVAEAKMAIKELSKDLIQKASLILSEKKELSGKQEEIAKQTPPEDEINADDFEALRKKKKEKKDGEKHPYVTTDGKEDKDSESVSEGYKKKGHNGKKHDCATKVEHAEWGPGTCIKTMHAEPDANGHVAWYDVMFEHGIEEEVDVNDLTVLISEKH